MHYYRLVQSNLRLVAVVVLLAVFSVALAEKICYQYKVTFLTVPGFSPSWVATPEQAIGDFVAACNASYNAKNQCMGTASCDPLYGNSCSEVSLVATMGTEPNFTFTFRMTINGNNVLGDKTGSVQNRQNPDGCPPDPCASSAGEHTSGTGTGSLPSGTVCQGNCSYRTEGVGVSIGGAWASYLVGVGTSCNLNDTSDGNCVIKGGVQSCVTKSNGKNCGTYNGDKVCVDVVKPGACVTYASGGMACASDAHTPPGPDNGTAGQAAGANMIVSNNGNTTNYYNSNTVNGSSSPATGAGAGETGDKSPSADGAGSSSSASSGQGSASGGESCSAAPSCSGDAIQCAQLFQQWQSRCASTTPLDLSDVGLGNVPTTIQKDAGDVSGSIDSSAFLAGGQCLPDFHVDLGDWGDIVVPLQNFCSAFQMLGLAIVASAGIAAAKIIVGASSEGAV